LHVGPECRWQLRVLDHRDWLHLRSHDPTVLELTLVAVHRRPVGRLGAVTVERYGPRFFSRPRSD